MEVERHIFIKLDVQLIIVLCCIHSSILCLRCMRLRL